MQNSVQRRNPSAKVLPFNQIWAKYVESHCESVFRSTPLIDIEPYGYGNECACCVNTATVSINSLLSLGRFGLFALPVIRNRCIFIPIVPCTMDGLSDSTVVIIIISALLFSWATGATVQCHAYELFAVAVAIHHRQTDWKSRSIRSDTHTAQHTIAARMNTCSLVMCFRSAFFSSIHGTKLLPWCLIKHVACKSTGKAFFCGRPTWCCGKRGTKGWGVKNYQTPAARSAKAKEIPAVVFLRCSKGALGSTKLERKRRDGACGGPCHNAQFVAPQCLTLCVPQASVTRCVRWIRIRSRREKKTMSPSILLPRSPKCSNRSA